MQEDKEHRNTENWSVNINGLKSSEFSIEIRGNKHVISIFLAGDVEVTSSSPCSIGKAESEVTLGQVLENYLAQRLHLRSKTRKAYQKIAAQRLQDWYDLPVTSITKSMVEERHQFISVDGGRWKASKVQANMTMRVLKLLLNFAMANYETSDGKPLISYNPVSTLTINKQWHRIGWRQGIIPDHKLADWYEAVRCDTNGIVRDYLLVVLLTGLRRSEAASLRWADIDFDSRTLKIDAERTKNHRVHRLPLTPFLLDLFHKRFHSRHSEFVFPGRIGGITQFSDALKRIRQKCGCAFTIHDLRRTYLTMAERLGIPHYALKKLANHSGGNDVTFGYLIFDVERLRSPMEQITDAFTKLMKC